MYHILFLKQKHKNRELYTKKCSVLEGLCVNNRAKKKYVTGFSLPPEVFSWDFVCNNSFSPGTVTSQILTPFQEAATWHPARYLSLP